MDLERISILAASYIGDRKWYYVSGIEQGAEIILNELLSQKKITTKIAKDLYHEIAQIRHGL